MQLYAISVSNDFLAYVVARGRMEAGERFMTWSAADQRAHGSFKVSNVPVVSLQGDQRAQILSSIAGRLSGISHFQSESGWTFSPPMSVTHAVNELSSTAGVGVGT